MAELMGLRSPTKMGVAAVSLLTVLLPCHLLEERGRAVEGDQATKTVELANRTVSMRGFPEVESTNQSPTVRGTRPYVVVCAVPADKPARMAVEASGARVLGFLPPDAFQVEADESALRKLSADPRFAAAAEFLPADKIDGRLMAALQGGPDALEVSVISLQPADRDPLRDFVTANGGELLAGCLNGRGSFRAKVPASLVGELAKRGDVRWLEPFVRPKLLNDLAVAPAAMNVREVWDAQGLSGSGQTVSTSDSGIDTGVLETMHRDLAERVCGIGVVDGCYSSDRNGHGTHTAGSIVGDGTMSGGAIRGTAWGARLWAWFCMGKDGQVYTPDTYEMLFRPDETNWPAFIHSASWGDDTAGQYDSMCADVDDYVWNHPDFLPVFANGNAGPNTGTVGSPAAAKNVLAVGAAQNQRSGSFGGWPSGTPSVIAEYSSRGPCRDGRIKPDIVAPGTGILSTRAYGCSYLYGIGSNTNYAYNCGTSMATPLVAGSVALVREWLVDRCGFTNEPPSAALMKAVITGGARGASAPNNEWGWGRVDLGETLFPSNRAVKLVDRIPFDSGTNFTYLIETTNAAPLDVQLVWIDHPASSGALPSSRGLVNNLDLSVRALVGADETVWLGNGGAAADEKNTLESVRIASAPATKYRIVVSCSRVVYDYTAGGAAALYVRGAFDPTAEPEPQESVEVTVSVEAGGNATASVMPAEGTTRVLKGQRVDFAAPDWACEYTSAGTPFSRRACRGFTGTGDAPASGDGRTFSAIISNATSVVWRYADEVSEFRFRAIADLDGDAYLITDTWLPRDSAFSTKLPEEAPLGDPYNLIKRIYSRSVTNEYRLGTVFYARTDEKFGNYLVSGENGRLWDSVEITMDEGIDLWFYYFNARQRTSDGLPYWWYVRYLWGGVEWLNYDGSATGDPDGDGFGNATEFADMTDPVDGASFRFQIESFSPPDMTFVGSTNGNLIVERSESPNGEWTGVLTNRPPRASVHNAITLPVGPCSNAFYRIVYEAPAPSDSH